MIPSALVALAIMDAAFAGFRAAAGRDGRISKRSYYARAVGLGVATGLVLVALLGLATAASMSTSKDSQLIWQELVAVGVRLVIVFGSFSLLVTAALLVYAVSRHEVRTLATVAILGPFTLARPWVVLLATFWATRLATMWQTHALTLLASLSMLGAGIALDAYYRHDGVAKRSPISSGQRALELGRPIILLIAFIAAERALGFGALPLAFVSVFASAVAVHDLIHNALYLPRPYARLALSIYAQLLIKSGHALRESHIRHHQLCLRPEDEEGRVAHESIPKLLATGPLLAIRARATAFAIGKKTRTWQTIETVANLALLGGLLWAGFARGSGAALQYVVAVVGVTVTAPIWGAKIPHTLPTQSLVVRWLAGHVGRLTPAAASVVFHELHHRAPRVPVALLPSRRAEIESRPASPCERLVAEPETRSTGASSGRTTEDASPDA